MKASLIALCWVLTVGVNTRPAVAAGTNDTGLPQAPETVVVRARDQPRDEKPYRNLLQAMQVFDENRAMAPSARMRFKVLPWHDPSVMNGLALTLHGKTLNRPIALGNDGTFELEKNPLAREEDASVRSNRPPRSLAWRADIRTPGLPPHTRRLGDLRLECKVDLYGSGADLATGIKPPSFWAVAAVSDPCMNRFVDYGFFADEPVFSVTLVSGSRRQTLPYSSTYAWHALPIADVMANLMDWHNHLRSRLFELPLHDTGWPDDTLVVLEPMDDDAAAQTTPSK